MHAVTRFAGVDVGGRRKGFHIAVIEEKSGRLEILDDPVRICTPEPAVAFLRELTPPPQVVAVDSPIGPAPRGCKSRPCERKLARSGLCNIRYTPDRDGIDAKSNYYEWIQHGCELYKALRESGSWTVIECFPTASWTRLGDARSRCTRAKWSRDVLQKVLRDQRCLRKIPSRHNQDVRDAIVAAYTAYLDFHGCTDKSFEPIIVPK